MTKLKPLSLAFIMQMRSSTGLFPKQVPHILDAVDWSVQSEKKK